MSPGTKIRIEGHPSVLNGANAVVIEDGPEVYFVTLPEGIRALLPREYVCPS